MVQSGYFITCTHSWQTDRVEEKLKENCVQHAALQDGQQNESAHQWNENVLFAHFCQLSAHTSPTSQLSRAEENHAQTDRPLLSDRQTPSEFSDKQPARRSYDPSPQRASKLLPCRTANALAARCDSTNHNASNMSESYTNYPTKMPEHTAVVKRRQLGGTGKRHSPPQITGVVIAEFCITSLPLGQKNPVTAPSASLTEPKRWISHLTGYNHRSPERDR